MMLMLLVLLLAKSNGLYVSSWCWFVFGVDVFFEVVGALIKAGKK